MPWWLAHNWAMKKASTEMDADDEEGIKALKTLRCNLTGEQGVKNVQYLFIRIHKIRKRYRLRIGAQSF